MRKLERLKKALFTFKKDERGTATVWALVSASVAVAALVIIFAIVPMIGYQVDSAVPIPAGSQWNATENTQIVSGVGLWGAIGPLIKLVAIVSFLGLVIASIIMLAGSTSEETQGKGGGGI